MFTQQSFRADTCARLLSCAVVLGAVMLPASAQNKTQAPEHAAFTLARKHLYEGSLKQGVSALNTMAQKEPTSPEVAFAEGSVQVAFALERFGQSITAFGFQPISDAREFFPHYLAQAMHGAKKRDITFEAWNETLETLRSDLDKARTSLAKVGEHSLAFRLEPARVRFDINGDGVTSENESLWMLTTFQRDLTSDEKTKHQEVTFDAADAAWLRGYSSLAMAKMDFLTGYNTQSSFTSLKELLFGMPVFPHPLNLETEEGRSTLRRSNMQGIASAVMAIHSINWPIQDAERLKDMRTHVKDMIAMSRLSWKLITARTDREALRWIPGPGQKSVLKEDVSQEMIDSWMVLLTLTESVLDGKKLIPAADFWDVSPNQGFNLRRFFETPEAFDLVGLIAGQKAVPFMEVGDVLSSEDWGNAASVFRGNLAFYALWFN